MAALVMETSGTQEYLFRAEGFLARISESYGSGAAAEMAARMPRDYTKLAREA